MSNKTFRRGPVGGGSPINYGGRPGPYGGHFDAYQDGKNDTIVHTVGTSGAAAGQTITDRSFTEVFRNFNSAAGVGNAADATDDTLDSFSIPASFFNATSGSSVSGTGNQRILGTAWLTTAANANTKTVKLFLGATSVTINNATAAPNNKTIYLQYEIIRQGANLQTVCVYGFSATTTAGAPTIVDEVFTINTASFAITDTAAITLKITGSSGSSAANDVLLFSHQAQLVP